ncbi:MAG TPA: polymer-forming cytoskeletal protein [Candidatus Atribacteria bacterium]|nr:polymer-forming cytoskeletal protein [Candidatus Atribacteria bacterium]
MPVKEISKSIIGENSYFEGKFYIKGELEINGKFEGTSIKVDNLYIGKTGKVKSNIKATSIIIEGIVIGNLLATNRIILYPTARVLGNIRTPEIIIQKGVIIEGRCTISNDLENPAKDLIQKLYEEK